MKTAVRPWEMSNESHDNYWRDFNKDVQENLVPKLESTSVVLSLQTGNFNAKQSVELGVSILMDKPIILIVEPGTKVSSKLTKIADAIVEGPVTDPTFKKRLDAILMPMLEAAEESDD